MNGNGDPSDDDTDGDGTIDGQDTDDDNDLIDTITEGGSLDTDSDGVPNYRDNDDDGDSILTVNEDIDGAGTAINDDSDGDGAPNYLDADDDNDGVNTLYEENARKAYNAAHSGTADDFDGDGNPNHLDTDSDGDSVGDLAEWWFDDASVTSPFCVSGTSASSLAAAWNNPQDCDGDKNTATGGIDALDTDDDGDSISTLVENGVPNPDSDGTPPKASRCFSATDGWDFDQTCSNNIGDGIPAYLDTDSDGDGFSDFDESNEAESDYDEDTFPNYVDCNDCDGGGADADGDGISNENEGFLGTNKDSPDSDGDGVPDNQEPIEPPAGSGQNWEAFDTDGDGIVDAIDDDDDDDGVKTRDELDPDGDGVFSGINGYDTDEDGYDNYLDTDDDNDGVDTIDEPRDANRTVSSMHSMTRIVTEPRTIWMQILKMVSVVMVTVTALAMMRKLTFSVPKRTL